MSADVLDEMKRLWADVEKGLDSVDAESSEAQLEKFLDQVVVLRGVEFQTVYPGLEEADDDEADKVTAVATKRADKIQAALEKLSLPPSAKVWKTFADAVRDHLDKSPDDVGKALEALSADDRAELGELTKSARETLS